MVGGIAAFWYALWRLIRDSARRVQATMDEYERLVAEGSPSRGVREDAGRSQAEDAGEVIVVREERNWEERRG
jgi:hypothetical protein